MQWPSAAADGPDRNPIRYLNDGVSQTLDERPDGTRPRLSFPTASGRAVFFARPHLPAAELPDDDFPFVLNTGRLQHQWHTLTKTGKVAKLNKLNPGPFVELHPQDARALGIAEGDTVEVASRRGRAVLPAVVTDRVRPGNCFAPFHWNDLFGEYLSVNAVTNDAVDPISFQPEFKVCAVSLARVAASGRGHGAGTAHTGGAPGAGARQGPVRAPVRASTVGRARCGCAVGAGRDVPARRYRPAGAGRARTPLPLRLSRRAGLRRPPPARPCCPPGAPFGPETRCGSTACWPGCSRAPRTGRPPHRTRRTPPPERPVTRPPVRSSCCGPHRPATPRSSPPTRPGG